MISEIKIERINILINVVITTRSRGTASNDAGMTTDLSHSLL